MLVPDSSLRRPPNYRLQRSARKGDDRLIQRYRARPLNQVFDATGCGAVLRMNVMQADEIATLVTGELKEADRLEGWHGIDAGTVHDHLVYPPRSEPVRDCAGDGVLDLWVVAEEDRDSITGYVVVFDEAERTFGLAGRDASGALVLIGYYGSLVDTLNAM